MSLSDKKMGCVPIYLLRKEKSAARKNFIDEFSIKPFRDRLYLYIFEASPVVILFT
jgi:hypothetical protein